MGDDVMIIMMVLLWWYYYDGIIMINMIDYNAVKIDYLPLLLRCIWIKNISM